MCIQFTSELKKTIKMQQQETTVISLPLEQPPDNVRWFSDPPDCIDIEQDATDLKSVRLTVRSTARSFVLVKYTIEQGQEEYKGDFTVLVKKESDFAAQQNQQSASPNHPPGAPVTGTTPRPAASLKSQPVPLPTPAPDSARGVSVVIPDDCHQLSIQVLDRNEMSIVRGRTYTIGRGSSSLNKNPDFVLDPFFDSDEQRKQCSRSQASILWSDNAIIITCTGRTPLQRLSSEGIMEELPQSFTWNPDETLMFPGGVQLRLSMA